MALGIINIAVEDFLSEAVVRKLVQQLNPRFAIGHCYCRGGYGYLKRTVRGFNNAAKGVPFLMLVDLEAECPPTQIREWLSVPIHPNFSFRVAVKEVESWLIADRLGFASFLGISRNLMPNNVDGIDDPKQCLINLAKRSRNRKLREAIVPSPNSTAKVGPDYNGQLSSFVFNAWNTEEAMKNSDSLSRAINAISKFHPVWKNS